MPTWPITLPQEPLEQGYEETLRQSQKRSSIDGLPLVQAQRSPGYTKDLALRFQFTSAQLDIFQAFYRDDLGYGAIPFTWVHPRTGSAIRVRFIGGQSPKSNPIGYDTFHCACPAEVMP